MGLAPMIAPLFGVHLADGQLAIIPITVAWILCLLTLVFTSWGMAEDEAPAVALFAGVFFLGSLLSIPVPAGPKTHLLMTGMLGLFLGAKAFPAILIGCSMQALLFAHGGPASIAMNSMVMGLPSVVIGVTGRWLLSRVNGVPMARLVGFVTGASAAGLTVALHSGVLLLWGQGSWAMSVAALVAIHIPLLLVEGAVSGAVVGLIWKARPSMLGIRGSHPLAMLFLISIFASNRTAQAAWHRLEVEASRISGGAIEVFARFSMNEPADSGEVSLQDEHGRERYRVAMEKGKAVFQNVESGEWLVRVWASDHYGETLLRVGESSSSNGQIGLTQNIIAAIAGVAILVALAGLARIRGLERRIRRLESQVSGEQPSG